MSLLGRLKTAIKGNPVLKEHDIGKHVASAGPGLLWKVYNGVKKSTQQEVSIFIFTKHTPEIDKLSKDHREELFEMLKKGPTYLAKLRHPKILTLHHTVEESSDCIAFATEPVFCCLANILGHYDNLPSPLPLSIKEFQMHSLEGHYGLLQIAEALGFLHSDVKMIHGNINPENIIVTKNGDWKLAGFNFATYDNYQSTTQTSFHFKEYNSRRVLSPNPHLDYLAPEYILSNSFDTRSDLYSFGMTAYALHNGGSPLYQNNNNTRSFKHNAELISRVTESALGDTPLLLRTLVRELLATEPSVRPDGLQIVKHAYFDDVLVSTLRYLDSLYSKSDMEKSQWFKTVLGKMIIKLPKRIVHQRVIPLLVAEFRNHKMIPFVLPIILLVADDCTMYEYSDLILPILIPVFKIHDPIQIPLIILQKMDLILKKTSPDEMKQHILPMILAALESENTQVQELCVSILPTFAEMIDYSSMKHSIIPRLTTLCVSSSTVGLSIKCLVTLGQIVETLDKDIVLDQVIPVIVKVPSREPGVLMGILGIFHKAMTCKNIGFSKELVANRVLPYLIPLSIQTTLNKNQFNQFMVVIKELLKKMETDHILYLDQVAKMEEQTKSTVDFAREVSSLKASEDALKGIETMSGVQNEGLITTRVGSGRGSGGASNTQQKPSPSLNPINDVFSGLDISNVNTNSQKATPTMSGMRKIDFSESQASSSPQTRHQPLGTWDLPTANMTPPNKVPPTSNNDVFSGMNVSNVGQAMGGGASMGGGRSTGGGSSMGGGGGANNILQPTTSQQSNSGMGTGLMQPNSTAGTGTGLLQPNPGTGWSSSINESNSGMGTRLLQPNSTAGAGTGLLQPNPATGWSNSINESNSGMGTGLLQPNPGTGIGQSTSSWSPSINNTTRSSGIQPSNMGTGLDSGWTTNINQPTPGMGTGLDTGWTTSINQPAQGMGMGLDTSWTTNQQTGTGGLLQPSVATGNQPLQQSSSMMGSAGGGAVGGWSSNVQPQQPIGGGPHPPNMSKGNTNNSQPLGGGMAPGPNPFANFNSLI